MPPSNVVPPPLAGYRFVRWPSQRWLASPSEKIHLKIARGSSVATKCIYSPLRRRSIPEENVPHDPMIRLVKLLPSSNRDGLIQCELLEVRLYQRERYEALSYCWGDHHEVKRIECNGQVLEIRENLEQALRFLRAKSKPRVLWVDALCINQQDTSEKADQVPLMRSIYSRAERTLIWLGQPGDRHDRRPSTFLRLSLVFGLNTLSRFLDRSSCPTVMALDLTTGRRVNLFGFSSQFYLSLISILQRPWFRRAWVVQEVTVSPTIALIWDQMEYDWDSLVYALKSMSSLRFPLAFISSMQHIAAIEAERLRYRDGSVSLLGALMRHKRTRATDQRDKVFSFTGLVDESKVPITVSYTAPTAAIYRDTSLKILEQDQNLAILSQPPSRMLEETPNLPSWVPNWSAHPGEEMNYTWSYGPLSLAGAEARTKDHPNLRFSAASNTKYQLRVLPGSNHLVIEGQVLDFVATAGKVFEGIKLPSGVRTYRDFSRSWMNTMRSFFKARDVIMNWKDLADSHIKSNYATAELGYDVFWETVCAGEYKDEIVYRSARLWNHASRFSWISLSRIPPIFDLLGFPYGSYLLFRLTFFKRTLLEFELQARYTLYRKMVSTSNGHIGLASCQVKAGDAIVLCKGSNVPILLRKLEHCEHWTFVGDIYIHGIMEGQAFKENECRDIVLV
jgi:hypothetical protein